MENKRILVTGAAGFVGHACARECLAQNWQVVALVNRRDPKLPPEVERIRGSIAAHDSLRRACAEAGPLDGVIHCAARVSDIGQETLFRAVNYEGVVNLVDCVKSCGIPRLVHVSTTDVYGLRDFRHADETTPLEDNVGHPYPRYKIMAEEAIRHALPSERFSILRPAAVYGPGDRTLLPRVVSFLGLSPYILHFGKWRGRNRWPLAHVRNVARAARLCLVDEEARGEAYNVLDPQCTTLDEFYRLVLQAFLPHQRGMRSITLPFASGWLFGTCSEWISNRLGREHPLMNPTRYAAHAFSSNLDFSSAKLEALFARQGKTPFRRDDYFQAPPLEKTEPAA